MQGRVTAAGVESERDGVSAFGCMASSCLVHQDVPHHTRGSVQELRAVPPVESPDLRKAQPELMNQRDGLYRQATAAAG